LKVLPGTRTQIIKRAWAVMVQTMFRRRTCAGGHDVLVVVVGDPIRTYKRLGLQLGRPHVSARTPLVA